MPVSESSGHCVTLLGVKSSIELKLDSEFEGEICGWLAIRL